MCTVDMGRQFLSISQSKASNRNINELLEDCDKCKRPLIDKQYIVSVCSIYTIIVWEWGQHFMLPLAPVNYCFVIPSKV